MVVLCLLSYAAHPKAIVCLHVLGEPQLSLKWRINFKKKQQPRSTCKFQLQAKRNIFLQHATGIQLISIRSFEIKCVIILKWVWCIRATFHTQWRQLTCERRRHRMHLLHWSLLRRQGVASAYRMLMMGPRRLCGKHMLSVHYWLLFKSRLRYNVACMTIFGSLVPRNR
jgi:hypothetical protein